MTFFGLSTQVSFGMTFFGLSTQVSFGVTFFGLLTQSSFQEIDANQRMTQIVSRGFELIQLMNQATFHGIDSESTHDSSRTPGIDSD